MSASPQRPRRTQEERSTATRAALLDATVECLVEFGYGGVTTNRVVERAGVSRGAQVHHYPTKHVLVVEAMKHLARRREGVFEQVPGGATPLGTMLDRIWDEHSGPLFQASMELWVAARTDRELRESLREVEVLVLQRTYEFAESVLGAPARTRAFRADLETVLATMRGLAQLLMLTDDPEPIHRRWRTSRKHLVAMLQPHLA